MYISAGHHLSPNPNSPCGRSQRVLVNPGQDELRSANSSRSKREGNMSISEATSDTVHGVDFRPCVPGPHEHNSRSQGDEIRGRRNGKSPQSRICPRSTPALSLRHYRMPLFCRISSEKVKGFRIRNTTRMKKGKRMPRVTQDTGTKTRGHKKTRPQPAFKAGGREIARKEGVCPRSVRVNTDTDKSLLAVGPRIQRRAGHGPRGQNAKSAGKNAASKVQ